MGSVGHTMRGINQLITMVENRTAHGFLIDRNTFHYFNNRLKEEKYKHIANRIQKLGLTMTEKYHGDDNLKCGMLVRDFKVYKYFKGYFDNNRLVMHSCNDIRMNTRKDGSDDGHNFISAESNLFKTVMTYILVILGLVVLIGIVIEIMRCRLKKKKSVSSEISA